MNLDTTILQSKTVGQIVQVIQHMFDNGCTVEAREQMQEILVARRQALLHMGKHSKRKKELLTNAN